MRVVVVVVNDDDEFYYDQGVAPFRSYRSARALASSFRRTTTSTQVGPWPFIAPHDHLTNSPRLLTGTQERIVLVSGELESVTHALSLIIEHLHTNANARYRIIDIISTTITIHHHRDVPASHRPGTALTPPMDGGSVTSVKLLIAKSAGGLLIGRGGATIKVGDCEDGADKLPMGLLRWH
jgi:hypothetical protein